MLRAVLLGTAAGAVGTAALNVATYADMVIRGRPASEVPSQVAGTLAEGAGLDLSAGSEGADRDATARNRRGGLGALLGYLTGLGVGAAYGLLRPRLGRVSLPLAGAGLGLAAMAASDIPAAATGATDPRSWGAAGWAADIVPHLAYGLFTAAAFEAFDER